MNLCILTVFYGPLSFLKESLEHNYSIFKNENISFKHYLIDNNFPLESSPQHKEELRNLCQEYGIVYINVGKNMGMIASHDYFAKEIEKDGIIFNLEADAFLVSQKPLETIISLHSSVNQKGLIYFNNEKLNTYPKKIFKVNGIEVFELILEGDYNHDWSWVQSFSINIRESLEVNKILLEAHDNYDVPGEKSISLKNSGRPILVINNSFEDMMRLRYSNYMEYQFYKAFIYFYAKKTNKFKGLSFENFIKNYDQYLYTEYFVEFLISYDLNKNDKILYYFSKTKNRITMLDMLRRQKFHQPYSWPEIKFKEFDDLGE